MLYQLPNGKTVEISLDDYLNIPDDKFDEHIWKLVSKGKGSELNDPFTGKYSTDCDDCPDSEDVDFEEFPFHDDLDFDLEED